MSTFTNSADICQALVQARSYSGEEDKVADVVRKVMEEFGFDSVHTDRYGNVIGIIEGDSEGPVQLYDAHIDTVPVPDEGVWSVPPFSGEIREGRVYGRGTSDMKGALASMLAAARNFAQKTDRKFKGKICVAGVVHEECFEGVSAREISSFLSPDYVIIGEASALNLKHGQRGRAEILIETFGKPAHSANPEHGINAVYHMAKVINAIQEILPATDPHLGKGILELVDIKSSPYPGASVVPDYCKTTWDRRLLVDETKESVLAPVQEKIETLKQSIPSLKAEAGLSKDTMPCYTGEIIGNERFFPGWYYNPEEAFVKESFAALKEHGFDCTLTHYDFCTNGSHYAGEAGIKTIGFGPSQEFLAHTIDEYIEIEQLEKAEEGYAVIMDTLQHL